MEHRLNREIDGSAGLEIWNLIFLALLVLLMAFALGSGYPVAFSSAWFCYYYHRGWLLLVGILFTGNVDAYFAQGGPGSMAELQGVTNLRGVYWEPERDTLIAIPLFIFMGIMLQRSKIAEDLLMTMAQLFGPVPGGLGISVVFVGLYLRPRPVSSGRRWWRWG